MKKIRKVKPLKKQFIIEVAEEEILLDCNFRLVEIIERVYELNADFVVIQMLSDPRQMLRSKIAEVIALWCQGKTQWKHSQLRERVMLSPVEDFKFFIAAMQGAVLFCTRQIDEEKFDHLVTTGEFPEDEDPEDQGDEVEDEDEIDTDLDAEEDGEKK